MGTGSHTITSGESDIVINTDISSPKVCQPYKCEVTYVSGIDFTACISTPHIQNNGITDLGVWNMDTNACNTPGTGSYTFNCGWYSTNQYSDGGNIDITMTDVCTNMNPPQAPAALTYRRRDVTGTDTVSITGSALTSYIGNNNSPLCVLSGCKIVDALDATTCLLTTNSFFTASQTGTSIDLTLDTSILRASSYFCLECTTNDQTPEKRYSTPFTMEVIQLDCLQYITLTTISSPFAYTVPATPAGAQTTVLSAGSSYATTALPTDCPLTYTLKTVAPDATYSGSQLTIDGAGKLTVDTNTLSNDNYYIQISSSYGAVVNTNNFQVKVECGTTSNTITNPTLGSVQTFTIDGSTLPTFSVPAFTIAQAACPLTAIDIFDSVGGTSPPAFMSPGTIASPTNAFSVSSTRMNTKATYNFYMRVTTAGGMQYWANVAGN